MEDSAELRKSVDFNLGSEWFTRVWVFQEVVFSHNPWIQCGRARVRWDRFCNILTTTLRTGAKGAIDQYGKSAHSDNYQILSQMQEARAEHQNFKGWNDLEKDGSSMPYSRKGSSDSNMLELLQTRRSLGVTDPRGMMHAHVGFTADSYRIQVDYSKTCAEIYVDFAHCVTRFEGTCPILYHVSEGRPPKCGKRGWGEGVAFVVVPACHHGQEGLLGRFP